MPFTTGSLTCVIYRVVEELPDDFHQKAKLAVQRYAFRPINAERGEDRSGGWVNPLNVLESKVDLTAQLFSDYLYLGLRVDKKSPNTALLKARVAATMVERLKDGKRKRLSNEERKAIQAEQRNLLLRDTSPNTTVHEMLWNVEGGWLFFSAHSPAANNEFLDIFADTFGLELLAMLPYTYGETFSESEGLSEALDNLSETLFFRRRAVSDEGALHNPYEDSEE